MTEYRLEVPDDVWTNWKDTVPRSQTLNERLVELITADLEASDE